MSTKVDSWPTAVLSQINGTPTTTGLLVNLMGPIRVAQKIFPPPVIQGNDLPALADIVENGIPTVGRTRRLVSILKEFKLADLHVDTTASPGLPMLATQITLAGQALALAEDALIFQGKNALPHGKNAMANGVEVMDKEDVDDGLLGLAEEIKVEQEELDELGYGLATYNAVIKAITEFTKNSQTIPYALVLDTKTFGDVNFPLPTTLVTPLSAIQALVTGGVLPSPGLPPRTGLMIALGGSTESPGGSSGNPNGSTTPSPTGSATAPAGGATASPPNGSTTALTGGAITSLIIGTPPTLEFTRMDGKYYVFTVRESIQFYNTEKKALIKFKLPDKRRNKSSVTPPQTGNQP